MLLWESLLPDGSNVSLTPCHEGEFLNFLSQFSSLFSAGDGRLLISQFPDWAAVSTVSSEAGLWPPNTDSVFQHDSSFWKLKQVDGSRRWVDYSKARKSLLFVFGI